MFDNLQTLVIKNSMDNDSYLLFIISICAAVIVYLFITIMYALYSIKILEKTKKMIEEGHEKIVRAKFFGEDLYQESSYLKKMYADVPSEEERSILFN